MVGLELGEGRALEFGGTIFSHVSREVESEGVGEFCRESETVREADTRDCPSLESQARHFLDSE